MTETIVSKYSLACDKSMTNTLLTSIIFLGYCIGSAVGGPVSDRLGRIFTVELFTSCFIVVTGVCLFIDSLIIYAVMRVVQGMAVICKVSGPKKLVK